MLQGNVGSRLWFGAVAALICACGGGGDDGASSPPPQRGGGASASPRPSLITQPAPLDRSSTRAIAAVAIAELDLAEKPRERRYLPEVVARAREVVANVQDPCPEGGAIQESQNLDEDLTGTIIIVFRDCVQDGARQNGSLTIHVQRFDPVTRTATHFGLEFENLTFSVDPFTATAQGTAAVATEGPLATSTFNLTGAYAPDDVASRLEDVVITQAFDGSGARRAMIAGRVFHSRHGYVDVSTLEELVFTDGASAEPASGMLRLTGAQNATADIRFAGPRVAISLDADANGQAEAGLTTTWLELRDAQNLPPAANAGEDLFIQLGDTATVDASASVDWEGDALTYEWQLASRPQGSSIQVGGSSPSISFRPDAAGVYELQATVRDAHGGSSSDRVAVTVRPGGPQPPNFRPIADAGRDQITVEGQSVTIDGSRSRDPGNDPLTFAWQLVRAPEGSAAGITATSATFVFMPDRPGIYDLRLTVSDGQSSDSDTMRVLVDRLVRFISDVEFRLRGDSLRGDDVKAVGLRTSPHYRGAPVAISASSSARWLTIRNPATMTAPAGESVAIVLQLDRQEVRNLRKGTHDAEVTAVPAAGQTPAIAEVSLRLR